MGYNLISTMIWVLKEALTNPSNTWKRTQLPRWIKKRLPHKPGVYKYRSKSYYYQVIVDHEMHITVYRKRRRSLWKYSATWVIIILLIFIPIGIFSPNTVHNIEYYISSQVHTTTNPSLKEVSTTHTFRTQTPAMPIYNTDPINRTFIYCLNGTKHSITITLYYGVVKYMKTIPRTVPDDELNNYWQIMVQRLIDNKIQDKYLSPLIEAIRNITNNSDDQVRIAVSLVQQIPYDWAEFKSHANYTKSPYETLYYDRGVCSEKSFLLAYLLKKLGYGVVLLDYKAEKHMAVAIQCPERYATLTFDGKGYCFIETTIPTIITYIPDNYVGFGKLKSKPNIILVNDGKEFNTVYREYKDAREYERLEQISENNNHILPEPDYERWKYLVKKYCIPVNNSTSN